MANYYDNNKKAAIDLKNWIDDKERGRWSEFLTRMSLKYGFGRLKFERMITDCYPDLLISGDKLNLKQEFNIDLIKTGAKE